MKENINLRVALDSRQYVTVALYLDLGVIIYDVQKHDTLLLSSITLLNMDGNISFTSRLTM